MIIIHAHFQIKADKEQAFLEEVRSLVSASRAEEGNISYDLMKDTEKEQTYTMVETWKDGAAVEAHNTSEHFIDFGKKAPEYMAAPIDVQVFAGEKVER
ncbi:antibiotic biosynthesis monooxygenase [Rossellomorea aquimaris]|uniref:putative quinol monooxygenase n=1 Tax=Rossellomorea aquimaris TaxID=189382 RepID=UPI001CD60F10|nr:putative quinol monooxygenase [Rossellomorea aquimaris]MCA1055913.1 antibiotic biosynthesis monooxygenase [Rossellomorea aquimaris]